MSILKHLWTIALWEVKNTRGVINLKILPVTVLLFVILAILGASVFSHGIHLQDEIYALGLDDPAYAQIVFEDPRFVSYHVPDIDLRAAARNNEFDVVVMNGWLYSAPTGRGSGAKRAFLSDYDYYSEGVYLSQADIFAAFPLWINTQYVKSPLDFTATSRGIRLSATRQPLEAILPSKPVTPVDPPEPLSTQDQHQLREQLINSRLTQNLFGIETPVESDNPYDIPSRVSPPLPFDAIIFVFIFVFPLYFTSQFYMMSIMNERTLRQGEALLSAPISPVSILIGKMIPYGVGMLIFVCCAIMSREGSIQMLYPLIPIILFFLSAALFIGMTSRSYRELSFISLFFSTLATSYLFFPTIFAHVHVVGLLSPVTLVIYSLEGTGYTALEYVYSTALFYLISFILIVLCIRNYREEFIFSEKRLLNRWIDAVSAFILKKHPCISIAAITILTLPFIFMVEMLILVLFFNLPMPLSLMLIMSGVALTEEIGKSIGLLAIYNIHRQFFTWKNLIFSAFAVGFGFFVGEKLLLFVSLPQISDSIFGLAMFLTLGLLLLPLLLHTVTALITGCALKFGGKLAYPFGILCATFVHLAYNWAFLTGWFT